jgi:hypothetical protein
VANLLKSSFFEKLKKEPIKIKILKITVPKK